MSAKVRTATSFALVAVAFAAGASLAFARAPKSTEMPTVEEIYQHAKQALEGGGPSAGRPSDPTQDVIDAYKEKKTPLADFKPLTGCINDPKESTQHRESAYQAIVLRFQGEDLGKPEIRSVRRAVALEVIDLMKVDAKKDATGLDVVSALFDAWWRPNLQMFRYVKSGSKADRTKAYERLKKMLKDES
jgi:hypothetical protein